MKNSDILKELNIVPGKDEISLLEKNLSMITDALKTEISKQKIEADVFIGGSFAKGTLVKKNEYDIDIFVRFANEYQSFSDMLEKIVKNVSNKIKIKYEKLHGSRDYFRIKKGELLFEIIPVLRVKKPKEAKNVTDLSYFHVNYVKKKINESIAKEIIIAKSFCKAQEVYGAESYIQGFSGYALECLLIYYKTFEKMLKEMIKVGDKLIIDGEKQYKNKEEILLLMNESKTHGPIILVDPTWKERNVLAALSNETFIKFKSAANAYLKNKKIDFFIDKKIDVSQMEKRARKINAEFVKLNLKSDKQAGDIAGTKLKKFYNFISNEIEKEFEIIEKKFNYDEKQSANIYFILKSKGEIIRKGPPIEMKKAVASFKKANKKIYNKNGYLYAKIKISYSAKRFLSLWAKKYNKKIKEMDITGFSV